MHLLLDAALMRWFLLTQSHNCSCAEEGSGVWKKMEVRKRSIKCDDDRVSKHRRLTPLRVVRGVMCLLVFLLSSFMLLVYLTPGAVLLRLFSIHYCRKATCFFFGLWLSLWPFLFEKINGTKFVFSGENVPDKERILLIANHRTEVDWMYLWNLAARKSCLGDIKYVLKSSLMGLPVFNWGFHVLEFISVERSWEVDQHVFHQMLSTFKNPQDPLWLALFPEGTDFTEEKCKKGQEYATKAGLPLLTNVLLPKTKGFSICLEALRDTLDAVYDVSIGYKHNLPSFLDNVFGVDPSEVHIHVQRVPVDEIPPSHAEIADWLIDRFKSKDKLLSQFKTQGHFPNQLTEQQQQQQQFPSLNCLLNSLLVFCLTAFFTYLTFFSSKYFKFYVALTCTYLVFATHLQFHPIPILPCLRSFLYTKRPRTV